MLDVAHVADDPPQLFSRDVGLNDDAVAVFTTLPDAVRTPRCPELPRSKNQYYCGYCRDERLSKG